MCIRDRDELLYIIEEIMTDEPEDPVNMLQLTMIWMVMAKCWLDTPLACLKGCSRTSLARRTGKEPFTIAVDEDSDITPDELDGDEQIYELPWSCLLYTAHTGVICGSLMLTSDDYGIPEARERAREVLTNEEINAVARKGESFRPCLLYTSYSYGSLRNVLRMEIDDRHLLGIISEVSGDDEMIILDDENYVVSSTDKTLMGCSVYDIPVSYTHLALGGGCVILQFTGSKGKQGFLAVGTVLQPQSAAAAR